MQGSRIHSHKCLPLGPFGGGFCSWGPGSLNTQSADSASQEPSETNRSASELSADTYWLRIVIALLGYYLSHLSNGELSLWIVLFIWNWHLLSTYFVPVTCPNHFAHSNSFNSPNPMKSVGAKYATGDQWRNNSRKNEGMEPKQKQYPAVHVTGDRSKVPCCKEQYWIATWNVRSMNQGKLEVVIQEMARVNFDILGISKLKWTGMGEFNSDDHYIYQMGRKPLEEME